MYSKIVVCLAALILPALGIITLAFLVLVRPAEAQSQTFSRPRARPTPGPQPYSVVLENEQGERLRTFYHQGKTYVLGELGARYTLRITNQSDLRVEAVITVDGRDAITGQIGSYATGRGYVILPRDSLRVEGFRQSLETVASFRFSHPSRSYSARMGTPENVGVIGVAFFPERRQRPEPPAWPRSRDNRSAARKSASPAPGQPSVMEPEEAQRHEFRLGTEYGESRWSVATAVPFVRANPSHPTRLIALYYDDAQGLESRGITVFPDAPSQPLAPVRPNPFPAERGFAPPPG